MFVEFKAFLNSLFSSAFAPCKHFKQQLVSVCVLYDASMFFMCVSAQTCLMSKCSASLVEPSVQLMRKCLPRTPLPLPSDVSAYSFPLPGGSQGLAHVDVTLGTA